MPKIPGPVSSEAPEIDGFCFSEIHGYSVEQINRMAASGKIWVTEFTAYTSDNRVAKFGGTLIADSEEDASAEAIRRDLGEVVLGPLELVEKRL